MTIQPVSISIQIIKMMLRAGEQVSVNTEQVKKALKITPDMLEEIDNRVPISLERSLWDVLVDKSGDEFFGLHAGCTLEAGEFDVMDFAIRTSPTLRQALENACRYNRLLHDVAVFELVVDKNTAQLQHYFKNDPAGPSWQASDFTLASVVTIAKAITANQWSPLQVEFMHDIPDNLAEYEALFACPMVFNCERNSVIFDPSFLTIKIEGNDPPLQQLLCRHADDLLAKLPQTHSIVDEVKALLAKEMRGDDFSIEAIAKALNTTPRSLQRRLKEQDTSYHKLVEDMRKNLASHYLEHSQLGISEIAYMLGYSEPSAFHRAFKRWFDTTVSNFRQQVRWHEQENGCRA